MKQCCCKKLKEYTIPNRSRGIWGIENMKRCTHCESYFITTYLNCQCCGYKLRVAPHTKSAKDRLRKLQSEDVIIGNV